MVSRFRKWWQAVRLYFCMRKITASSMRDVWPRVRGKVAGMPVSEANEYIVKHSTAVVHRQVEALVRVDPAIDASMANRLIVRASEQLSRRLKRRAARVCRPARHAA